MSWGNELEPTFMLVPKVAAIVRETRSGTKLHLHISESFCKELDLAECNNVVVQSGQDEYEGKTRLEFVTSGKTKVTAFSKGGKRIIVPAPSSVPKGFNIGAIPAEVLKGPWGRNVVVIGLPIDKWREILTEPTLAAPTITSLSSERISATNYLRLKGHSVYVTESGVYKIDQKLRSREEVLKMINYHRNVQELAPVSFDEIDWKPQERAGS